MNLIEQIRAEMLEDGTCTQAQYVRRMEAALLAADRLAEAVRNEREMVCQDFELQASASRAVDDALAAYRKATQ